MNAQAVKISTGLFYFMVGKERGKWIWWKLNSCDPEHVNNMFMPHSRLFYL